MLFYYVDKVGDIMDYMTTKQAAEKWNISDRRVRTLCKESKIPGVIQEGKSYQIPVEAQKPIDGRRKNEAYKYF